MTLAAGNIVQKLDADGTPTDPSKEGYVKYEVFTTPSSAYDKDGNYYTTVILKKVA